MNIRLIEKTEMKKENVKKKSEEYKEENNKKEDDKKRENNDKVLLRQIPECMMLSEDISCERAAKGMTDNCAICKALNNEMFVRCKIKYK